MGGMRTHTDLFFRWERGWVILDFAWGLVRVFLVVEIQLRHEGGGFVGLTTSRRLQLVELGRHNEL